MLLTVRALTPSNRCLPLIDPLRNGVACNIVCSIGFLRRRHVFTNDRVTHRVVVSVANGAPTAASLLFLQFGVTRTHTHTCSVWKSISNVCLVIFFLSLHKKYLALNNCFRSTQHRARARARLPAFHFRRWKYYRLTHTVKIRGNRARIPADRIEGYAEGYYWARV